jgi:hypothetical protein
MIASNDLLKFRKLGPNIFVLMCTRAVLLVLMPLTHFYFIKLFIVEQL